MSDCFTIHVYPRGVWLSGPWKRISEVFASKDRVEDYLVAVKFVQGRGYEYQGEPEWEALMEDASPEVHARAEVRLEECLLRNKYSRDRLRESLVALWGDMYPQLMAVHLIDSPEDAKAAGLEPDQVSWALDLQRDLNRHKLGLLTNLREKGFARNTHAGFLENPLEVPRAALALHLLPHIEDLLTSFKLGGWEGKEPVLKVEDILEKFPEDFREDVKSLLDQGLLSEFYSAATDNIVWRAQNVNDL